MADVNANIGINFDTSQALAQLRQLQAGLSRFNQTLTQGNVAAMQAQKGLNDQLMQAINATGKFVATQKDVATSTSSFTQALEKNQMSMRQYFRYTAAAATQNTKVFKGMFAQERETLTRASKDRVKLLQSQYIQLQAANGNMIKTLQVIPKHLKMVNGQYTDYATRMQMAAQRQQFLNKLLSQGSTQLLNFGKNTQWAGRQLMVGLTIPLTILGSTAAKAFMEMEQAVTKFSRVYGDMMTNSDATDRAIADVQRLAREFTKFGIAAKDTVEMAASAAAMGLTGDALNAQIVQATRLAVLGQVEQQQALDTTISLTNAFGVATEDLAKKINFLNAVENQTVLSIEDLTIAIPKAGPVVKQLGGDVEDLAFFMTAMKEGGINASEGANALKSGLASMINPSKKASEFLAGLGINITGLVEANKGDLKGTVVGFARALDTLDPLNRARAIEQLFGKFQFARLSTLFQNVTKDSSQAARALGLAGASVEELAILSERELGKVEDMTGNKFKKSMENIKLQLIPIGKAFLEAVTPIVNFVGRILEKFNTLGDGTKKVITIIVGVIGGLAPVVLMTFGVLMNAVANGIKLFAKLRGGIAQLNGSNNVLGGGFEYLTNEQIENVAQANALHTSHSQLISTFNVEAASVQALAAAYGTAASQARALAQSSPGLFNTVPGPAGAVAGLPPTKFATGGVVPGTGNKDTVPALLTPGEVVITKDTAKANPELVAALQNGSVKRYHKGTGDGHAHPHQVPVPASISTFSEELGSRAKNPKDIAAVTESIQKELMKAYTRGMQKGGPEMADTLVETIKGALQAAADRIGSTNITFAKNTTKQTNPDTGEQWRAPYGKKSATKWQGGDYVAAHLSPPKPKISDPAELERLSGLAGDSDLGRALALAAEHGGSATPMGSFTAMLPEAANQTTNLDLSNPDDAAIHAQLAARRVESGTIETPQQFSGKEAKVFEMPTSGIRELFTGEDAGKSLAPVMREIARQHGLSFEEAVKDPAILAEMTAAVDTLGGLISEELALLPDKIGEQDLYEAVDRASGRLTTADGKLKTAVDNLGKTTTYSVTTNEPAPTVDDPDRRDRTANRKDVPQKAEELREELTLTDADVTTTTPKGKTKVIPFASYQKKNKANLDTGELIDQARGSAPSTPEDRGADGMLTSQTVSPVVEASPEAIADAEAAGESIGAAAADGVRSTKGTDADSPSKKGIKAGKEIADGIIQGMEEAEGEVVSQSQQLGSSAVPTAAETQAKVDKMDLDNKAFYDDIDTPEFRDQRQILKSQDRHRRKMGATGTVGGGPGTPPVPGPSSLTVTSTARTEAAAEDLAVSTEQAATAQSQVVQQIHDESKSRVTIKGNTINIGKARQEADRLDKEASDAEAAAARVRTEAAKWEEVAAREGGKNMHTAENAKALKKLADEAEIKAAEARIKAAEAELVAANLEADEGSEQIIQDPVKTPAKVKKAEEIMSNGTVEAGDGMRRIVDGTDETVDSTLLVAEQTDELASVTGEAVDAQTQTAGNLLTGAQITDATTGNMNDVLQSTDMTGVAQNDIAGSSQDIAETNEDILKLKQEQRAKLIKYNADEAARLAALDGTIPTESQTDKVVGKDRMDVVEAYEEAMGRDPGKNGPDDPGKVGYTKDKKGHLLFDPETGEPTTLTQKQITKKKRGMRKEKVAKYSGKATGALGTATMIAGAAGAPPQVTAALGTAATVAQFAPMIAGLGPIGLAVGAVVALGAGAFMLNKHFNLMAKKAAQFAKDLSATRDGLKSIGEVAGKVGASQIMDKRRSTSQYGKYDEEIKIDNTFGNKFLGTDVGKKEKKLFQDNAKKFGNQKAVDDLSLKLATAVADGVLDAQAANSIAAELALQLKDQKIEMQIVGQLSSMIGPNGEDLKNKPLETRAMIMANANDRVARTEADIDAGKGNQRENIAAVSAYNMNNIELATMMADQVQVEYEAQKKKLETELASTTNAAKKLEISQKISALEAANLDNAMMMNTQLLVQIGLQQKSFDKVYSSSLLSGKEDAYFDATRGQLETTYKGTDQEEASKKFLNTSESFNSTDFSGAAGQKTIQSFQAKMEMLVGSKVLSPTEANNYIELFSGQLDKFDLLFDASVQFHGPAKTKELLNMFAGYSDKAAATAMITEISLTKTNPGEFDAIMETLKSMQSMDGSTINMEVLLTSIGLEGLEQIKKQIEEIEALKETSKKKGDKEMDLDAVSGLSPINEALVKELKANETRMGEFKQLSLEQQAEYLQKLQTQYANELMMTDTERTLQAEKFARQQAMMAQAAKLIGMGQAAFDKAYEGFKTKYLSMTPEEAAIAKNKPVFASGVTSNLAGPAKTPGDKGKDNTLDFLDDLAMRIKMTRDAAFNAKKPLESMLAALSSKKAQKDTSAMFELFKGVQQTLIGLKVPKEFRDHIAGLSAQEFEDLEKKGAFRYAPKKDKKGNVVKDAKGNTVYDKTRVVGISKKFEPMIKAYREAPLNNFNIAQKEIITNTDNQFKAFAKLKAGTMDTSLALELLTDETLAYAIASDQIKGPDLEKFIKDAKDAKNAAEKFAVISDLLKKNEEMEFKKNSVPKLAAALKETGMSVENIQTVLSDPALAKQLMADLADGKIDSKAIADYLNNIKEEKIVEIKGKFNAGDFAGAAAPGMELVNKMFSVQEQLIRTGVDARSEKMVARLKDFKEKNENLQLDIQKITFEFIRPLEEKIRIATRDLEMKVTRVIEAYQEEISDLQHTIELAFEDPIADINAENVIMSQDMEVMNHAAEEINKRYDEQAKALEKVSEIKSQLVEKEKEQLDLADALSKGDIGAAARAVQAIRAAQAARNAENASKALELSRKNKIDNLRGEVSGRTKEEITERQYQNAKEIYRLENTAKTEVVNPDGSKELLTRLQILEKIKGRTRDIYGLEEDREARQLKIRALEDEIYNINEDQIKPKQDIIDANNMQIAIDEDAMQNLVDNIRVLGKTKDVWDGITAKIEASSLAGQDFDGLMGGMLASVTKIGEGWDKITETLGKYSDADPLKGLGTEAMNKQKVDMLTEFNTNTSQAKDWADKAKAKIALAQEEYDIAKKKYDLELESMKAQLEAAKARNDYKTAGMINSSIIDYTKNGPPKAPISGPSSAADNPNAEYNNLKNNVVEAYYKETAEEAKGGKSLYSGGSSTSGGGTSGGGTGTPQTAAQIAAAKKKADAAAAAGKGPLPGDKGYVPGSYKYVPPTMPAAPKAKIEDKRAVVAGSTKLSVEAEKLRADRETFQLQQQLSALGINTEKQLLAYKGDKNAARKLWDQYTKAKEYGLGFTRKTIGTGVTAGYINATANESDSAKIFRAQEEKKISPELKNLFNILKNADKDFKASRESLMAAGKGLNAARADWKYSSTSGKEDFLKEKDPKAKAELLTAWDTVEIAQAKMKDQNLVVDNTRKILKSMGYTSTMVSWQVDNKLNALDDEVSSRSANIYKWTGYATGGLVSSKFAQKKFNMGTDTVPAMLTPGEFVMNKFAVQSHGIGKMQAMNNGQAAGDSVYNYSISVNVKSESNPDEIARTVIAQIKSVDAQKMRGVRT